MRLLPLLTLCVSLAVASVASAGNVTLKMYQEDSAAYKFGTKVDGLEISTARWTGWIHTGQMRSVVFDIDFTDADSSVTAVTMVCETSRDTSTTNDSGRDLHALYDSATQGTSTSVPHIWKYTTAGTKSWTWMVGNVPAPYLNCKFYYDGGTPASADVITVYARGVTP